MATLKVNGSEIRALGPIELIYNRDGSLSLSLGVEYSSSVEMFDTIELYNGTTRLFVGKVRGPVFNEAGGIKSITAWDWKGWMREIPYFGASSQVGTLVNSTWTPGGRNARVKYAYTETELLPRLPVWKVGTLIQNIIQNASIDSDGLPNLWDVLPSSYKSTWVALTNFSTGGDLQGIQPFGHQFDGVSVAEAIDRILGKYFPAYGWWIDPANTIPYPRLYKTYVESAAKYDIDTVPGLYLDNVTPIINNCFTRVIVEGRAVSKVSTANPLPGFVDSDYPFQGRITGESKKEQRTFGEYTAWFYVTYETTETGFNTEDYRISNEKKQVNMFWIKDPDNYVNHSWTARAGYYGKDARWRYDTGFGGTANASPYNLKRTLIVIDDTVGSGVVTTDAATGAPKIVDRHLVGEALATGIWDMLKDVRWVGSLLVPNSSGKINPLQRVKILHHPKFGEITFRPSTAKWNAITGELTYSLGDSRRNPLGELQLRNQINWRDRELQRKREPLNIKSI